MLGRRMLSGTGRRVQDQLTQIVKATRRRARRGVGAPSSVSPSTLLALESLEERTLFAVGIVLPPTVNITASKAAASETAGSTTGKGTFTVTRTGATTNAL